MKKNQQKKYPKKAFRTEIWSYGLILSIALLVVNPVVAQEKLIKKEQELVRKDSLSAFSLSEYAKPTIELNPGQAARELEAKRLAKIEKKTKKRKRNVFYGKKSKKRLIVTRKGRSTILEVFYVAKEFEHPREVAYEKSYFDRKNRKIVNTSERTHKHGHPLHGTYLRIIDGDTVDRRIYYMGTRHGRWESYTSDGLLREKQYYFRGHPKESKIDWYDVTNDKLKEVIPIQHGERNGIYMSYFPSGRIKETGKYEHDEKIGIWTEYYDREHRNRKKQIRYPNRPLTGEEPKLMREWNEKGKQIYPSR